MDSWTNYLDEFCQKQHEQIDDWEILPDASRTFLTDLDLPRVHPYCTSANETTAAFIFPSALPMGSPVDSTEFDFTEGGFQSTIEMAWDLYGHPIIALMQIWAKLFAAYVAPIGLVYIIVRWRQQRQQQQQSTTMKRNNNVDVSTRCFSCIYMTTLYMSWMILTDDQYLLEFGRSFGAILVSGVLLFCPYRKQNWKLIFAATVILMIAFPPWKLNDPDIFPKISPGIYSNSQNTGIQNILESWNVPEYSDLATPWQFTGDARTGLPYIFNDLQDPPKFHRVWLETDTEDATYVALDIAFPPGGHDPTKPLYLVLHGLNGGSEEGYVKDLAASRTAQGSTVVVMIARGLMDTPILGWTIFNGVRIADAHKAASTLRQRVVVADQTFAGVGYSIGAIVLNNYVATYQDQVALDIAVTISGALYCPPQAHFMRSQVTWQVPVAAFTKEMLLIEKWGARLLHQLGSENYQRLLHASSVVDLDRFSGVLYNGYDDLTSFYEDMSPINPFASDESKKSQNHFAIPHLILQSFDDPLSIWTTNADNDPTSPLYPSNLVKSQENLVVMLTSKGGHVGWPIGIIPDSWEYMNTHVAAGFIDAFHKSKTTTKVDVDDVDNDGTVKEEIHVAQTNRIAQNQGVNQTCSSLYPSSPVNKNMTNSTTVNTEKRLEELYSLSSVVSDALHSVLVEYSPTSLFSSTTNATLTFVNADLFQSGCSLAGRNPLLCTTMLLAFACLSKRRTYSLSLFGK